MSSSANWSHEEDDITEITLKIDKNFHTNHASNLHYYNVELVYSVPSP